MWFLMIVATYATECEKYRKTDNYYRMVDGDRILVPTNSNYSDIKVNDQSFYEFNKSRDKQINLEIEDPQKVLQIQWNKESNIIDLTTNNYLHGNLATTCYYLLYTQNQRGYIYATSNLSELQQITKSEQLNQNKTINLADIFQMPVDCAFMTSQQYYNTFILFCLMNSTKSESGQEQYFLKFFNLNCDNDLQHELQEKLSKYQLNSTKEGPFPNAQGFELRYFSNVSLNQEQEFLIKLRLQNISNPLFYNTCVLYNLTQSKNIQDGIDCFKLPGLNESQENNILTDIMFVASNISTLMLAYARNNSGFNFLYYNQVNNWSRYQNQDLQTFDNDSYYGISINRQNNFSQIIKANNYLDISILSKYYITEIRVRLLQLFQPEIKFKKQRNRSDDLYYNRFYSDESYYYLFSKNRVVYIEKKKDSNEININQTGINVTDSSPFRLFDVNDFKTLQLSKYFLTYDAEKQILYQQPMFYNYSLKIEKIEQQNLNESNYKIKLREGEQEVLLQITTLNNSNMTCYSCQLSNIDQQTSIYPLLYSCRGNGLSYELKQNSRYVEDSVKLESFQNANLSSFKTPLVPNQTQSIQTNKEMQLFQQQSIFSQIDHYHDHDHDLDYLYLVYQYDSSESIVIQFKCNHDNNQGCENQSQINLTHNSGNLYNFDIIENDLNIVFQGASFEYEHIVVHLDPDPKNKNNWTNSTYHFNNTTVNTILTHIGIDEYKITEIIQFSHPYFKNNFFLVNIKTGNEEEIRNYLIINEINSFEITSFTTYEIIILENEKKINVNLKKVELSILDYSLIVISSETRIYYGNMPTFNFSQGQAEKKKQLHLKEFKLEENQSTNCTVDFKTIDFKKYRLDMPPGMLVFQFCNGDSNNKVNETETARVYLMQHLTNGDQNKLKNPSRELDLGLLKLVGAQTSLYKLLANQTFNVSFISKDSSCYEPIQFRKKGSLFDYRVIDYYLYVISSNSLNNSNLTILVYNLIDFSVSKVEIPENKEKRVWVLPKNYTYIPSNNYEEQVTQNYSVIQLSGVPDLDNNCSGQLEWNANFMRTYFSSRIKFQSNLSSQKVYKAQINAFNITNQLQSFFQITADFQQKDPFLQFNITSEENQLISSRKQNFLVDDSIIIGNIDSLNFSISGKPDPYSISKYLNMIKNYTVTQTQSLIDYVVFRDFIIYIDTENQSNKTSLICKKFVDNKEINIKNSSAPEPISKDCKISVLEDSFLHSDNLSEYNVTIFIQCKQPLDQPIFNLSLPNCNVSEQEINQNMSQVDITKHQIWPTDQVRFVMANKTNTSAFCKRFTLMGLEDGILKISNDKHNVTIAPYAGNTSEFFQIDATSFDCSIQHVTITNQDTSVIFSDFGNKVWRWKLNDSESQLQLLFKDPHKRVQVINDSKLIIRFDNYFSIFSIPDLNECKNQNQTDSHSQIECLLNPSKSVNFSHSNDMSPLFNLPIIILNDSIFIQLCKEKKNSSFIYITFYKLYDKETVQGEQKLNYIRETLNTTIQLINDSNLALKFWTYQYMLYLAHKAKDGNVTVETYQVNNIIYLNQTNSDGSEEHGTLCASKGNQTTCLIMDLDLTDYNLIERNLDKWMYVLFGLLVVLYVANVVVYFWTKCNRKRQVQPEQYFLIPDI